MKIGTRVLSFVLVLLLVASPAWAVRKTGQNSAKFLDIGVGARHVALGSASTTLSGDPNCMFWNPAGAFLPGGTLQAAFTYNKWIGELSHNAFAVSRGFNGIGTVGIGVVMLGLPEQEAMRDWLPSILQTPEEPGDLNPSTTWDYSDMAVQVTYARMLTDRFTFGASLKYIQETIDATKAGAVAFDFGSLYQTGLRDLTIGARINNLGSDIKFHDIAAPIPLTFSVGLSMSVFERGPNRFRLACDATKPRDNDQAVYAGGEYWFSDLLAVRGGYKFNYSGVTTTPEVRGEQQEITAEGFSVGAGANVGFGPYSVGVDYAFTEFGVFDSVHRVTVSFQLE